jgi:hypothetical protein
VPFCPAGAVVKAICSALVTVTDNAGPSASEVLGGRKRKAVDSEHIAGPSVPRKLRKCV